MNEAPCWASAAALPSPERSPDWEGAEGEGALKVGYKQT